ncbi:glutathionylspermidine synthase family protein [Deinococcus sp. 12RED42]|uniref:glutathionylspermidine synthase family protein n=1 Tax=Deinococcus sp. 12RED42 TaxID=2745872 RepID=UPI001E4844AC|nr:glutathionylspermidine synthase family protein [Deinococcus sp. 12RED42]MCD0165850.1 glutathionylspermidine synthase family protein [Deinococcus sp. 12RED42]
MIRRTLSPRPDWEARLREVGFTWFAPTPEHPVPYWSEDGYYAFTPAQIGHIRAASQELTTLVLEATGHAIERGRLAELGIPAFLHSAVRDSWERDDPTVYMRLDLAYDGQGGVKLLEVNAQTPTSLLEAAVSQWQWLEDQQARGELPAGATQWNTIHEGLTEQWAHLKAARGLTEVAFSSARVEEDAATVTYLRELAGAAGLRTSFIFTEDLGTSATEAYLLDTWSLPLRQLMWLWPFEFAWESRDSAFLASTGTRFIEPLWKAVTGSKGLLALLHELNPGHPHLLPATLTPGALGPDVVRKPLFSREGQNVQLPGQPSTPGDYGDLPVVEQAYTELPTAQAPDGPRYPVLGVWVAGDEVCGLGIREGRSRVTDNRATFAPHVVLPA